MRKLLPFLPVLLAGPVTGPLLALAVVCGRRGQWARAGFCIAALGAFWVLAPMGVSAELLWVLRHG